MCWANVMVKRHYTSQSQNAWRVHPMKASRRTFIKGASAAAAGALLPQSAATAQTSGSSKGEELRRLVQGSEPVLAPAAHDVLTARLIEQMGFPVVTVGGSAGSAQHVIPHVGLIT